MIRAVVTGGTGFVGANLTRRLLRDGYEVHLLVRPEHAVWRIEGLGEQVRRHVVDLTDRASVTQVMQEIRPDRVFHLAAYGAYPYQTEADRMLQTNVLGTQHLVEAAFENGVQAFVHAGSSSEYGKQPAPAHELEDDQEERQEPEDRDDLDAVVHQSACSAATGAASPDSTVGRVRRRPSRIASSTLSM